VGISNLIQVKGFDQRWDGDFLVGSLKGQTLFRLRFDRTDNSKVLYSEPIWIGQRIRDILQLDGQTIVIWTDNAQLMYLRVDQDKLSKDKRSPDLTFDPLLASCLVCHHFGLTKPTDFAPTLSNIVGKKIASDSFEHYSPALKGKPGEWTEENLRAFIQSPNTFANGSKMPELDKNADVDKIVDMLKKLGDAQN
jgi:cytochrome c2